MYYYSAFDLIIRADLPFPSFMQLEHPSSVIDISIEKVAKPVNQADSFYYQFEDTLHIWVTAGKAIRYYTEEPWEERYISLFLLNYGFMGLFYQRGLFPLHGGTIVLPDGRAVIITGPSGAGKSTTVAQFAGEGYKLLGDEIALLSFTQDKIKVLPSYPEISVFEAVYDSIKNNFKILTKKNRWSLPKKIDFNPEGVFNNQSAELAGIVFLNPESSEQPTIWPITGSNALQFLREQSLNYLSSVERFGLLKDYFDKAAQLCNQINMMYLSFPRTGKIYPLTNIIVGHFKK